MNVDGDSTPAAGSSSIYTPSRSYKMASKILEQLDKLTPPKEKVSRFNLLPVGEKSPPRLLPSTVHGLPLRSLEDVDLPRSEEFIDDDKRSNGFHGIRFHDNRDHTFQKQEKMENMKPLDPHRWTALVKDSGSIGSSKDSLTDLGVPASAVVKSTIRPQKNIRAFQKWPDNVCNLLTFQNVKDSLDLNESSAYRVAPAMTEVREEGDISLDVRQTTGNAALAPAKPQTTSEVIAGSPLKRSSDLKTSDDPIDEEKDTSFTFQNASSLCTSSQQEAIDSAPTFSFENKDLPENKQSDPSVFSFGNNVSPQKQPNDSSTVFDVGNKVASLTESCAASENGNKAPYTQCNSASSYSDVQESEYLNMDTSSNHKLDRSCRTGNDAFSSSASISAGLAFSFSWSGSNQCLNNGPSISCPFLFSFHSPPTASMNQSLSSNIFLSATSVSDAANIAATDNHPSTPNLAPSSATSTTGFGICEDKIKQDTSLHNANDTPFSSMSTPANSHYSMFSFSGAAAPSSVDNQLITPTVSSATELSAQAVSAGKEFAANTERMSSTLGSSVSLASSGLAGKASVPSGISFGYSSPASELFNPGSWPLEFPIVGFTSVPTTSTVSTSNVSTSKAPFGFESSSGAPFSSTCPTTSAAALAGYSSKPVPSKSHPTVAFRVSSGKNDYEEHGISKDNASVFSQKPISPPSSGFSFVSATSESNPFEFGKQQTLAEPQLFSSHFLFK